MCVGTNVVRTFLTVVVPVGLTRPTCPYTRTLCVVLLYRAWCRRVSFLLRTVRFLLLSWGLGCIVVCRSFLGRSRQWDPSLPGPPRRPLPSTDTRGHCVGVTCEGTHSEGTPQTVSDWYVPCPGRTSEPSPDVRRPRSPCRGFLRLSRRVRHGPLLTSEVPVQ